MNLRCSWRGCVVALLTVGVSVLTLAAPVAQAGRANRGLPGAGSNPIAHVAWGVPHDDDLWSAYQAASGSRQALLGKLALVPRVVPLGWSWGVGQVRAEAAGIVAASQNGNPHALTEFATFVLNPWETKTANGVDKGVVDGSSWNVRADQAWYRNMAAGIGSARALVIVQVDLPVAHRTSSRAPERIDTYAARVLSALPHTTVYSDGGTSGWLTPEPDATLRSGTGVRYARGFALN
ncbi:MAG: hypothetical protein ACRDKL_11360, partial [Solirubrobacteraceae bacterium]